MTGVETLNKLPLVVTHFPLVVIHLHEEEGCTSSKQDHKLADKLRKYNVHLSGNEKAGEE